MQWKSCKKMMDGDTSGSSVNGGNSRWNPTKEQISMLEDLYKQGMRTPSAEQIHQITGRLTDFGHIEGKNVFYWFQNHKARQRQKQKQESLDRFNRYLHCQVTPPVFPTYYHHPVGYNLHYLPQSDPGLYQQCPNNMMSPSASPICRSGSSDDQMVHSRSSRSNSSGQETLDLFPMHPTGILQGKTTSSTHHHSTN